MKEKDLDIDLTCHVVYSKECKKEIKKVIEKHYNERERTLIWKKVQTKYVEFLKSFRTDLGGKKNFHNCKGGTYDCIAIASYYVVCKDKTSLEELETIEKNILLPSFKKLKFVDINKPLFKKLMYIAFKKALCRCNKWNDYKMHLDDYNKEKPLSYDFTECPVARFAKENDLLEIMPAFCNPDYDAMELIHAKLIRKTTCSNGKMCDYVICGDKDPYIKGHKEYIDKIGYKRNK